MTLSSLLRQPAEQQIASLPLPCSVSLPDGERIGAAQPQLSFVIRDMRALWHLTQGAIGRLAEDYVEGRLEIEGDMQDLMATAPALLRQDPTQEAQGWLMRRVNRTRRAIWERTHHSRATDAAQIRHHYDISDDFYALWLDPLRVYSCAYFSAPVMSLAQAQQAKLDHICRKLMLRSGERFLDVGAGWGALLMWAAEHYGVTATGITLSTNQHVYVDRLIEQKGLRGRVRMLLQDYRDVDESVPFDKIASVGMCEHVGRPNLPLYFEKMHRLLRPGGLMMNHSITAGGADNPQLDGGMGDFIDRYIFPGGQLVHVSVMMDAMTRGHLEPVDAECLRPHYVRTLWHWAEALDAHLDEARRVLGRDAERIIRAYRLYLAGSAMGFEQGWTSLFQILAARSSNVLERKDGSPSRRGAVRDEYPFNRSYMYERNTTSGSARSADNGPVAS
ncbi:MULTISPECIES: class I SAM-dependent methyltransferase [Paraburkholderia]|uniref:class I SAM-dependent methyltransferase n=1 Tax=Paraburkholderia TaxID=1822464 RepID=UPI0003628BF8|nr:MULTISPECIES: class I SAM-dependent methyltransferase [Paraburkholderia]MDH6147311.1 cyclopropane-fatty-acyl-phospholipid synthase [Paraburkholderia sp. WSM4179]